jgi:hypothetical protein
MTTFGKILAVFNLLLSLGLVALCVFIYMARVNYGPVVVKLQSNLTASEAAERAHKDRADKLDTAQQALNAKLQGIANAQPADTVQVRVDKAVAENKLLVDQVKTLTATIDALKANVRIETDKNSANDATVKAHQLEVAATLNEKIQLKTQLQKEIQNNTKLQADVTDAREKQVRAEIERDTLRDLTKQMEERTQDLVKELTLTKKALLTGNTNTVAGTAAALNAPNPPAFAVDGKVMEVREGLVEISIGSDAGLAKGNTLDLFRLTPKSQYLGMIRLITVEPTKSVGQIVGKSAGAPQRGDNVASKILGN